MCVDRYSTTETIADGWLNPVIQEFFNFLFKKQTNKMVHLFFNSLHRKHKTIKVA